MVTNHFVRNFKLLFIYFEGLNQKCGLIYFLQKISYKGHQYKMKFIFHTIDYYTIYTFSLISGSSIESTSFNSNGMLRHSNFRNTFF